MTSLDETYLSDDSSHSAESLNSDELNLASGIEPDQFEPRRTDVYLSDEEDIPVVEEEDEVEETRVGNRDWCTCGSCLPMPRETESVCCQEIEAVRNQNLELVAEVSAHSDIYIGHDNHRTRHAIQYVLSCPDNDKYRGFKVDDNVVIKKYTTEVQDQAKGEEYPRFGNEGVGLTLTDVEVATLEKGYFGIGNVGIDAVINFRTNHMCNKICMMLKHKDFAPVDEVPKSTVFEYYNGH
ncbi:hypothetical protein QZH41_005641 [Actinostola sp. cb2023]|nr:hypothetical protein QZH41_005641 [Actinostola sp. cb2023]